MSEATVNTPAVSLKDYIINLDGAQRSEEHTSELQSQR